MSGSEASTGRDALVARYGLVLVVAGWAALVHRFWFVCDDAWITFRYSRNWASGLGVRYNPGDGQAVEGYSNFLWMALAAACEAAGVDPGVAMPAISAACGLALVLAVYATLRTHGGARPLAALVGTAGLAWAPPFAVWCTGGLATVPAALLMFACAERWLWSRHEWAAAHGAAFALALALIRAEGIAWVGVIGVLAVLVRLRDEQPRWARLAGSAAVAAVPFGVYSAWRLAHFGSLVANTARVKVGFGTETLIEGLRYVGSFGLTFLTPVLFLLGTPAALRRMGSRGLALALLAVGPFAYAAVVGGDYMAMGRLVVPALPFGAVILGVAVDAWSGAAAAARPLVYALAAGMLGVHVLPAFDVYVVDAEIRNELHFRQRTKKVRTEVAQWSFQRDNAQRWRLRGEALAAVTQPHESLTTGSIGAVGYHSGLVIYDVGGLVDREVADRSFGRDRSKTSPGHEKTVSPTFFLKRQPTYLQAELVSGPRWRQAALQSVRRWHFGHGVRTTYVPDLRPVPDTEDSWVVLLRRAQPDEDVDAAWDGFESRVQEGATQKGRASRGRGRWHKVAPEDGLTAEQREEIERLEALGYLAGSQAPSDRSGVVAFDEDRAQPGYALYTSGHAPEATLMALDGQVLHTWRTAFQAAWPERELTRKDKGVHYWRRATLLPTGEILAIFEGHGLIKVGVDSTLLWARENGAHHDLEVLEDGRLLVLLREAKVRTEVHPYKPILEDFVAWLDPEGNELRRISVFDALAESPFADLFEKSSRKAGDLFHTNSVELLDGRGADRLPELRAGNLLLSSRVLDALLILDPDAGTIVWAWQGPPFRRQHDPHLLDDGNLLVFDNVGRSKTRSRVLELDPVARSVVWSYGDTDEQRLFSRTCGLADRLDGGTTMVIESAAGRAVEVTREGEVVWEFRSPHRSGDEGQYIATLFEVQRLPPDFPLDWRD